MLRTCSLDLISEASPTRAPELAAKYTRGRRSARACSAAALNMVSSTGPKAPELKVMSLAMAMICGTAGLRVAGVATPEPWTGAGADGLCVARAARVSEISQSLRSRWCYRELCCRGALTLWGWQVGLLRWSDWVCSGSCYAPQGTHRLLAAESLLLLRVYPGSARPK